MIKFNEPYITNQELENIKKVFEKLNFSGAGYFTEKCQTQISNIIQKENILLTDSCTSALEISALMIRDWNKEQEVMVPSYTFPSTASAFIKCGFKVVFVDIEPKSLMIDVNDAKKKINKNTVAIVPIHYAGHVANIEGIKKLSNDYEIDIIEDAAQAFGIKLNENYCGTFGRFGCFSFHETKNIHAGLSGALVCNDEKDLEKAMCIWERGTNRQNALKGLVDKYSWVEIGGSFYPSELQAAFLSSQLENIESNRSKRKSIYSCYYEDLINLRDKNQLYFPDIPDNVFSNYHAFYIILPSEEKCDYLRTCLKSHNINAFIGYVPLHSSKVGKKINSNKNALPVTESISAKVLRLPFHNNLSISDVKLITGKINDIIKKK